MGVSVSLVTHQSRRWIDACLEGVRSQGSCIREILLVDNASRDGTAVHVRARHPQVRVEALDRNLGYAAAHNRNFARARGSHFWALNPDVVPARGYLERLLGVLDADPTLGAATGCLLAPGRPPRIDSAGIVRTWTRFVDRGRGAPPERFAREEDVFGACGAAALYRADALRAVCVPGEAPFAERLFMYYEDVDLAWRLRRAGWRTRYVPAAHAWHVRGGSGASSAFVEYHLVRNRVWVSLRNARPAELLAELPGLAVFQGVKSLQALVRPHVRRALHDQWRGLRACWRERRRREASA